MIGLKPKPNAETRIFRVQSSIFNLAHAVECLEHTHHISHVINIQIAQIVELNERNSTTQK